MTFFYVTATKDKFFSNSKNKERFIDALALKLNNAGIKVVRATNDADVPIVKEAVSLIEKFKENTVVVVGQDIDLPCILLANVPSTTNILFFKEGKGTVPSKYFSSKDILSSNILPNIRESILLIHGFSGADATSAFYNHGKLKIAALFKKYNLDDIVKIFNDFHSTAEEIAEAGEKLTLNLYKSSKDIKFQSLDELRYSSFKKSVNIKNQEVLLSSLPPTSAANRQHSYRVFYQIQTWLGRDLEPTKWGWKKSDGCLMPIYSSEPPAPNSILKIIACSCKKGCVKRCSCKKVE